MVIKKLLSKEEKDKIKELKEVIEDLKHVVNAREIKEGKFNVEFVS